MSTASIKSQRNSASPITGASRDDLVLTDVVSLESVNVGTAYQWNIAFKPEGSTAVLSSSGTTQGINRNPGTFTVDKDGPYLIRLLYTTRQITLNTVLPAGASFTINGITLTAVAGARTPGSDDFSVASGTIAGITADMVAAITDAANSFVAGNLAGTDASPSVIVSPTTATVPAGETLTITYSGTASDVTIGNFVSEQYVRLRSETAFGDLKLVAAGERYDTLRVPVDATLSGWADEQNYNLNQLLSLISSSEASGNLLYVDPVNGDYQTIQEAMDYADSQSPSSASPWVVLVRPGTYVEDLIFYDWVHVFGWPGNHALSLVTVRNATAASHTINLPAPSSRLHIYNITFQRVAASANPVIALTGGGPAQLHMRLCQVIGSGAGGCITTSTAWIFVIDTTLQANGLGVGDYALTVGVGSVASVTRCGVYGSGGGGVYGQPGSVAVISNCIVSSLDTLSIATDIRYSTVQGDVRGNPVAAGTPTPLSLNIYWSQVQAISLDGTNVVGASTLLLGASTHGVLTTLGGATVTASIPADSIFYDNTTSGITAANVQAALDEIHAYAELVRTLDNAYDGGVAASGSGRTIIADAGAVQIVDAPAPSDPIPAGNTNGNLEVVGSVKLGALTKPEITFDPNPFGNGPEVLLGKEIWANDAPFGSTALLLGDASGSPTYHNYNLRVGTQSADGGNQVGSLFLRGGDALTTINAGSVYIQGGAATNSGGGLGGHIYLVPGETSAAGGVRGVVLANPVTGTSATLTAAGAFSGAAVAGKITLGTELGGVEVTFAGGENLAAVHALFNATKVVTAAGDPIVLTTVAKGPSAEVFFLNADAGVDAALGTFSGQTMAAGTWPESMTIAVTTADEITFGLGDPNPMLYNSTTGKLTVPGLIDPTGVIFDEAGVPATGANKGAIFVSNTTGGGLTRNKPYYVDENGVVTELGGGGGGFSRFFIADTNGNTSTILDLDTINFVNTANETTVGVSGDNVTIGLPATGVAAGNYISPVIAVDVNGRITTALNNPGLQGAYNYGNTIVTAGPTDISFTLSAAGGGFRVNGDGNVLIGAISPINTFSMSSIANAMITSQDEIDIIVGANDAADKVLDLSATNAGAGEASIRLTADDEIILVPGTTVGVGNFKKVTLPDNSGVFFGTPQFGLVYLSAFNGWLIGSSGNAAPGSALSVAPGTTPDNIFMQTPSVDTNAAGAGSGTGAIEITSGDTTSAANTAGNSGGVSLKSGRVDGTTGGGNSGVVRLLSGESKFGNSGGVRLVTGQVQATSTGESGSIDLITGIKNGTGSNSGSVRLTTGNSSTTSGNVEVVTGTGSSGRGHLSIDTGHTRIREGAAPSGGTANFGKVHVDDGAGSLVAGGLYFTSPSGTQTRLDTLPITGSLDRHHINMPEAPNSTVLYKGWAAYACTLAKVKILCATANTQGTLILTIVNNATTNTVLSTANLNLNDTLAATAGVLSDDTVFNATLTGTASDLTFAEDDRWTITLTSNDPNLDAAGIYIDLSFEVT